MRAAELVAALRERGQTLAVAESLTGGMVCSAIADVPGASWVFRGGLVVYATDLKASLAGVPAELLAERGPVDPDVAAALAEGARGRCRADWGLGTTGVAGPDPQDGHPVGTVFVAAVGPAEVFLPGEAAILPAEALLPGEAAVLPTTTRVWALLLSGSRAEIRAATTAAALDLLAALLMGSRAADVDPAPGG